MTHTHILEPSDSQLLRDGVRVLTRLLAAARDELGAEAVRFHDHRRAAKRRALEIGSRRGAAKRARTYRKLPRLLARTVGHVEAALPAVSAAGTPWARAWAESAAEYGDLLARVVDQTTRRVFEGETVPAAEKVVRLFEPHTDIIRKGGRKTHYGHKVNLATDRSGLVLDAVVEDGNPADSARCLPMLRRHVEHYGAAPSRAAFDGGYASRGNLKEAKDLGVAHVVFNKKRGIKVADMTPSSWLYARLKRFRAGIEAGISYLKRCFGLCRCRWRGLPRFKAYGAVWRCSRTTCCASFGCCRGRPDASYRPSPRTGSENRRAPLARPLRNGGLSGGTGAGKRPRRARWAGIHPGSAIFPLSNEKVRVKLSDP